MKRILMFLMMLVGFIFFMPAIAEAQTTNPVVSFNIADYFLNFGVILGTVTTLVGLFKKYVTDKHTLIFAILIAAAFNGAGWLLKLGVFVNSEWYWWAAFSLISGFSAGGFADFIKKYILPIFEYFFSTKKTPTS